MRLQHLKSDTLIMQEDKIIIIHIQLKPMVYVYTLYFIEEHITSKFSGDKKPQVKEYLNDISNMLSNDNRFMSPLHN